MFYLFPFEFVCRSAPSFSFCLVFLGVAGASVCDLPHLTRSKASKEAALLALLPLLPRSKATVRQAAVISHFTLVAFAFAVFTIALGLEDEKTEVCLKHVRMTRVCVGRM